MQNAPVSFFLIFPISYLHRRFAVTVGMLADQDWPFWQVSPSKAQIQIRSHSQLSGSTASTRQRETFAKSHRGKEKDAETIEEGLTFGIRGAEEAVEAEREPSEKKASRQHHGRAPSGGDRQQDALNTASASGLGSCGRNFSRFLNLGWQLRQYLTELIGANLSLYLLTKPPWIWAC